MTDHPVTEQVTHAVDCPGPRVRRRNAIHYAQVDCTACGAQTRVPIRRDWQDEADPEVDR
jgi:RNase P subunit RPR2